MIRIIIVAEYLYSETHVISAVTKRKPEDHSRFSTLVISTTYLISLTIWQKQQR